MQVRSTWLALVLSKKRWVLCSHLEHTRRQALLQLVGLVGVLEHQGVQVALAPDLELGQAGLLALLDPGVCGVC